MIFKKKVFVLLFGVKIRRGPNLTEFLGALSFSVTPLLGGTYTRGHHHKHVLPVPSPPITASMITGIIELRKG